ncbi:MAG: PEP-CTERM sorting domain-containing protein [Opitutae bacterium]|nr:PEP-CTERM sorting domain-containing protein [Opitutae bacterium]
MKKLLTTAALLTIGTAASFATEFTLIGNSDGNYTNVSVSDGRAAFETITLDEETTLSNGAVLSGSDYSWSISFTVDSFTSASSSGDSATSEASIFSVSSGDGVGSGYGVIAYAGESDTVYYSLTSDVHDKGSDSSEIIGSIEATNGSTSMTISWDAVAKTLSLSVGETTVKSGSLDSAVSLTTYVTDATIGQDGSSVFWTNGGKNPISEISLSVTAVPEPSMFGLLAGLGAIGLVAARRRRNRKA